MFETVAIVAVVLAIAVAIVLILAAAKPDKFRVQRGAIMKMPRKKFFCLINDFRQWGSWSPWENRDLAMKRSFSGAERGTGAVYAWEGNKNVGSGRMEILDASMPPKIVIKLDFFKPFEGHNTAEFTMLPQGDATRRELGHVRSRALYVEGDAGVHEYRQDDRQGFQSGSCQPERAHRDITAVPRTRGIGGASTAPALSNFTPDLTSPEI